MYTDILVVGAGPCSLAVAARLSEATPSALFTDDEHARYWSRFRRKETLQKEAAAARKRQRKESSTSDSGYESGKNSPANNGVLDTDRPSMIVLDSTSDNWLAAWDARFARLQIKDLRSPLFFHPDPRDRDGLLAYAYEQGREAELTEIPNVAGREFSKHELKKQRAQPSFRVQSRKIEHHLRVDGRDRIDYFTPSTQLFHDYCLSVVERYGLRNMVRKASVTSIDYAEDTQTAEYGRGLCTVQTDQGTIHARIVVVATGPTAKPCLPTDHNLQLTATSRHHASHVFAPASNFPPLETRDKCFAIVGGGLTSAQVATSLLVSGGAAHVDLILRGAYKLKHFDVDLAWVSKTRNQRMAEFWSADTDEERADMLREARNGGSITPAFDRNLRKLVREGRLTIRTHTRIADGAFDTDTQTWALTLCHSPPCHSGSRAVPLDAKVSFDRLAGMSHVFFATGVTPSFNDIPFLKTLVRQQGAYPSTINGLPIITQDLQLSEHVPVFFTGALAALRLGPGAANLAGARQGAERIAWKVEEILGLKAGDSRCTGQQRLDLLGGGHGRRDTRLGRSNALRQDSEDLRKAHSEFTGSWSNQFQALSIVA
jgi:cation diffusion facilitator CzcD-associated flavoprotein CzcO